MKHLLRNMWLAMAGTLMLTGCITDDTDDGTGSCGTGNNSTGFYVINQGNTGYQILGSLDWINLSNDSVSSGVFKKANNQALGENPQNAVICGSKMYIAEYASNRIWVVSASTAALQGQIALTQPNKVFTDGTHVYATSNTGTVARIDTVSLSISKEIPVGPNPVGMTIANGYLYVANSDGYNYQNNYANGKSVSKIDLASFQEVKKIAVGLNPQTLLADSQGDVFVYCGGDYAMVPPMIQKITPNDSVRDFTSASLMAIDGEKLYLIKQSYDANWNSTYDYFTMNPLTGDTISSASSPMLRSDLPDNPTGIFVDPQSHDIFITSDAATPADGSTNQYALRGSVMRYCPKGYFQKRYNVNVHPVCIVFKRG